MSDRSRPAQRPPGDLAGFPTQAAVGRWFREHRYRSTDDGGCWYFSSVSTAGGGRWDLRSPFGTCYFGNSAAAAARERVGPLIAHHMPVPEDLVADRVISTLDLTALDLQPASLHADAAATRFGVTAELSATADYPLTQQWARALHAQGHAGLTYTPRFSPGNRALALFHHAGSHQLTPVIERKSLTEVLAELGIPIQKTPGSGTLTIIT